MPSCLVFLSLLSDLLFVSYITYFPCLQMEVEQLLSLSGSALAQAVSSLLETPGLYVFSDILELPNVREVNTSGLDEEIKKCCFYFKILLKLNPIHTNKSYIF